MRLRLSLINMIPPYKFIIMKVKFKLIQTIILMQKYIRRKVLNLFQIGSIVIGHTPQSFMYSNDINSTCDNKVWRVDNGSSSAFNNFDTVFKETGIYTSSRRTQYLEIINDTNYFVCDGKGCKKEIRIKL